MAVALCTLLLLLAWHSTSAAASANLLTSGGHELQSIPLLFETNLGQVDDQVRFLARPNARVTYFFTEHGHTVLLSDPAGSPDPRSAVGRAIGPTRPAAAHAVKVTFVGANPHPSVSVEGQVRGFSNYFLGSDPSRWRTHVPSYPTLRYRDLYDGIDLVYYSAGGRLEYDFVVHPGADPSRIRIRYTGADGPLALGRAGAAEIVTSVGSIFEGRPSAYQSATLDPSTRRAVRAAWSLAGKNELALHLGRFDRTRDLHIDPLLYSTFVGGNGFDSGASIAVDGTGAVYVTGDTRSTSFPTVAGSIDVSFNGGVNDAIVFKLNPSTSSLVYSTFLGGSGDDAGSKVVVDPQGNAFILGVTLSSNFPVTSGVYDQIQNGGSDAFVAKLDPTGTTLLYATFIGGSGDEPGPFSPSLAIDDGGNAYVVGSTTSTNFPTTAGVLSQTSNGFSDAFVTKLNSTGTALLYSTYLGGTANDYGSGVAVDDQNKAYVTGDTYSLDFPTTSGAYSMSNTGDVDCFVSKLQSDGSALIYSTYLGGTGGDFSGGIALDPSRNAYILGQTGSVDFPTTPLAFQTTYAGNTDLSVTKLSASGSTLLYSTYLGGTDADYSGGAGPAVNAAGEAFVFGPTVSTDYPVTAGAYDVTYNGGGSDAVVTKLNASGSSPLLYSTYLGGSSSLEQPNGLAIDASGNVWVTGWTGSSNFPTTPLAYDVSWNGSADVFVTELGMPHGGVITGHVFHDYDGDGIEDPAETHLPNWFIRLDPGPLITKTDYTGGYVVSAQPGTYTVRQITPLNWIGTHPASGEYGVTVAEGQTSGGNSFGSQAQSNTQDVTIDVISQHAHPYFTPCCDPPIPFFYKVTYQNVGPATFGTKICVNLPCHVDYQLSILSTPSDFTSSSPTQMGNSLCWTIASPGLVTSPNGPNGTIEIKVLPHSTPSCPCISTAELVVTADIDPTAMDATPSNNHSEYHEKPTCAFDPNDKQVTPKGCGVEGFISADDSLTYLIRFQNTGTGPAHLVVLRDTLDVDCDLTTVENLGSSHANLFEVTGRELKWSFWGIVLPDSGSDEPGSHGYVKFKVKLVPGVHQGTLIENGAGIYFDLNEVVLTNRTVNTTTNTPLPVAAFAAPPETLQVGTPIGFTYTGGTGGASFLWAFGPGATPANSTAQNPSGVTYSTPGFKNVILLVTRGSCESEPAVQSVVVVSPVSVGGSSAADFRLGSMSPNPTAHSARVEYTVAREARVRLTILDVHGREVARLVDGVRRPGRYDAVWSGRSGRTAAPAGVYFLRFEAAGKVMNRRIVVAR